MEAAQTRGRIFERPQNPRSFHMTERGVAILTNIARLRLASAAQLGALDGGSQQNVERTLLALWENGYVERPEAQAAYRRILKRSRSLIYGLTRKGARFLRQHGFDMERSLLDGIDKERGAGWRFIDHSVGISDFFVKLELAARGRKDLRVLERTEILEDAPERTKLQRIRLQARIALGQTHRTCGVVPDGFFGLHFLADETESYFMYEKDRGEMPVMRYKNLYGTYVAKKLLTYYEASRQRKHLDELGISNFRVLVETTTPDRVEQMLEAVEEFTAGRGSTIFLFTDEAGLAASNPLDLEWMSGKRERIRITA
jgi:predicted transcriptional regulator